MSRRDTIIVAVLINAGLLIVLFASALKTGSSREESISNFTSVIQETSNLVLEKQATPSGGDEVDLALKQFAQNSIASTRPVHSSASASSEPVSSMPFSSSASVNFTEDLKAIAIPETSNKLQARALKAERLVAPINPLNKPIPEFTEVKVKKGDVLEKIARQHHTTVAEIMKANKLTSSNLHIGQVLKIPNKSIKKVEPSTIVYSPQISITTSALGEEVKYYTVKKGDNPWTIAVKNHLKVEDLLKLNNMTEEQARRLKPGDQLRIQ